MESLLSCSCKKIKREKKFDFFSFLIKLLRGEYPIV